MALSVSAIVFSAWVVRSIGPVLLPEATFSFDCDEKLVALTIDDGPDPSSTFEILEVLEQYEARATFFLIGNRVQANLAVLEDIVGNAHELGNHTFREIPTIDLSPNEQAESISVTHDLLSKHSAIKWLRPGSGWYNSSTLQAMELHGYKIALADIYPLDHAVHSSRFHYAYITWSVRPGSVIILHDGKGRGTRAAESLRKVLPWLQSNGYQILTLTQMADHESCRHRI